MRVILDTDKKTITLPWNYREKLEAYNKMVMDISGDESKKRTLSPLQMTCGKSAWRTATTA